MPLHQSQITLRPLRPCRGGHFFGQKDQYNTCVLLLRYPDDGAVSTPGSNY
nr:MAG TPA_asm: hypothetical protein [Caudoviricetes sp.]